MFVRLRSVKGLGLILFLLNPCPILPLRFTDPGVVNSAIIFGLEADDPHLGDLLGVTYCP
jgi:hypothetical protein